MSDTPIVRIRRALLSVSDKQDLTNFAKALGDFGVEIISTGGTAKTLRDGGVPVVEVSDYTGFPEILEQPVPVYWLMTDLGMGALVVVYSVMLFGTFIETGAGMLQGINDRIDAYRTESSQTASDDSSSTDEITIDEKLPDDIDWSNYLDEYNSHDRYFIY